MVNAKFPKRGKHGFEMMDNPNLLQNARFAIPATR
jgi:hypothetical protein